MYRLLILIAIGVVDSWLGGVPPEQKMLKGHLPRVIYHPVYTSICREKHLIVVYRPLILVYRPLQTVAALGAEGGADVALRYES